MSNITILQDADILPKVLDYPQQECMCYRQRPEVNIACTQQLAHNWRHACSAGYRLHDAPCAGLHCQELHICVGKLQVGIPAVGNAGFIVIVGSLSLRCVHHHHALVVHRERQSITTTAVCIVVALWGVWTADSEVVFAFFLVPVPCTM